MFSPLSRRFEHDGRKFKIEISQAGRPSAWLLEILDEEGGSTVWDDVFDGEQEALDEAIKAIEEGLDGDLDGLTPAGREFVAALTRLEETEVKDVLACTKFYAVGVLVAAATGPQLVSPREWLALLLREDARDEDALRAAVDVIMSVYNGAISCLEEGELLLSGVPTFEELGEWAAGYLVIATVDDVWTRDDVALARMNPLVKLGAQHHLEPELARGMAKKFAEIGLEHGVAEKAAEVAAVLKTAEDVMGIAVDMYDYWASERHVSALDTNPTTFRRVEPKVGRNQPCSCGSGKKYKRCCGRS